MTILIAAFAFSSLLAADKFVVGGEPGAAVPAASVPTTQNMAVSAAKIRKLREETAKVTQVPQDGPNGWNKSTVDLNKMLELFKPLRLRKGYVLRAYQYKEEANGNGVVWAIAPCGQRSLNDCFGPSSDA